MFEMYDPRQGKRLMMLNELGRLEKNPHHFPVMSDGELKLAYEYMVRARVADEWAVSLNRQGRMPTYALNQGQEANSIASMMALEKTDWMVLAFRELSGMMYRGYSLDKFYQYWLGDERGNQFNFEEMRMTPICVPIASQVPHAVGIAYAEKIKKSSSVVIVYVGDGGTSEGYFYESLNFASVWKVPVIFYIQNNQWAISVPKMLQTTTSTYAEKAFACGMEGIQVDGNDPLAVYAATKIAADKARSGGGPVVIEGFTYRLGPHTTADDPTRYREDQEVEDWRPRDPLIRTERYLISKGLLTEQAVKDLLDVSKKEAMAAFDRVEKMEVPQFEDTYRYIYQDMPIQLQEQMARLKEIKKK